MHPRINLQGPARHRLDFRCVNFVNPNDRLFERYLRRLSPGSGMILPVVLTVPRVITVQRCTSARVHRGTVGVHRLHSVHRVYMRASICITNEAIVRAHTLSRGPYCRRARGPLARARPATPHGIESSGTRKGPPGEESYISNDTAVRLFELPLSSLFLPFSPSRCPSVGAQSGPRCSARFPSLPSTRACRTRGRSPSSPRGTPENAFR